MVTFKELKFKITKKYLGWWKNQPKIIEWL